MLLWNYQGYCWDFACDNLEHHEISKTAHAKGIVHMANDCVKLI